MKLRICIVFLLIAGMYGWAGNRPGQAGWKAGVAKMVITPKEPLWMGGYAVRDKPADGKLHDLWAKALFLEDASGNKALLITADLVAFPKVVSDRIRDGLQAKMGLSRAQIILNSSHTHSGPVLSEALTDIYPMDDSQKQQVEQYTDWLAGQIVALGQKAQKDAEGVTIYSQNGVVRFQVNRRHNTEKNVTAQTALSGPNDFAVPVLKITDKKGKIKALAFGYACHPTVLGLYQWSGDYAGFAQIELEKKYRGATALFFQGAGADMNPMPRHTVALAQQFGQELAAAVVRVLNEEMKALDPELATAYSEIDLELNPAFSKDELERLKSMEKTEKGYLAYKSKWAERMLTELDRHGKLPASYPYPVQVWRIGDQLLTALGGEVLVSYSIQLKRILGSGLFVLGYSNDVMTYIPSEDEIRRGGYEVESAPMVYGMPSTWKTGLEEKIIGEVLKQVQMIKSSSE
ncbi:MAG: neutral/alkaline non-lysosomal ceramidase N-terminal domain-containing protein [Prolixibacteraceae bacterium]